MYLYCDQCDALAINGTACHEADCPHIQEDWIKTGNCLHPTSVNPPNYLVQDNEEGEEDVMGD